MKKKYIEIANYKFSVILCNWFDHTKLANENETSEKIKYNAEMEDDLTAKNYSIIFLILS